MLVFILLASNSAQDSFSAHLAGLLSFHNLPTQNAAACVRMCSILFSYLSHVL